MHERRRTLELVDADAKKLKAYYFLSTRTLQLQAEGKAQETDYGFQFTSQTSLGGLIYRVEAWIDAYEEPTKPYCLTTDYPNISLLPGVRSVLIITKNYPNGKAIPITVAPGPLYIFQGDDSDDKALIDDAPITLPKASATGHNVIAVYKEPFEIKQSTTSVGNTMGSIKFQADPAYLTMENARFDQNEIVWTFNSIQTGDTQIKVTINGGLANYITTVTYDVKIIVLDWLQAPHNGPNQRVTPTTTDSSDDDDESNDDSDSEERCCLGTVLDYVGRAVIAHNIVEKSYPDAKFHLVSAKSSHPDGVTEIKYLDDIDVTFNDLKCNRSITMNSHGFSDFHSPHVGQLMVGNAMLDGIPSLTAEVALARLRKQGYTQTIVRVDLVRPLGPGGTMQNLYNFTFWDGAQVSVPAGSKAFPVVFE